MVEKNVALIGAGRWGKNLARNFFEIGALHTICDRSEALLDSFQEKCPGVRLTTNFQGVLDNPEITRIVIAAPAIQHYLLTKQALEAGKDVYVEKPMAHSFWEGQQCIKAAKKYNRIVQHGTQQRSDPGRIRDMKLLHDGEIIGPVVHARGYVYKNGGRVSIGHGRPGDPPDYLDYNLWLGPAQERPFLWREGGDYREQVGGLFVHYCWHWFWDFGNGESGNQGVHEMDVAAWAANKGLPVRVSSTGGRYAWDDDGETPNTQAIHFTYADGTMLTFEVRNLGSFYEGCDEACANSAFGTNGYWVKERGFFDYRNKPIERPADAELPESKGTFGNFIQAVKSRKWEDIHGNPEEAFISCAHIHLGNIAYRLKRDLEFDPATNQFKNDDEANAMLKANYREPFVVPEIA